MAKRNDTAQQGLHLVKEIASSCSKLPKSGCVQGAPLESSGAMKKLQCNLGENGCAGCSLFRQVHGQRSKMVQQKAWTLPHTPQGVFQQVTQTLMQAHQTEIGINVGAKLDVKIGIL